MPAADDLRRVLRRAGRRPRAVLRGFWADSGRLPGRMMPEWRTNPGWDRREAGQVDRGRFVSSLDHGRRRGTGRAVIFVVVALAGGGLTRSLG